MDKILKGLTLYKDNTEIGDVDRYKFFEFIRQLKSSRKVRFIYRGESNLTEQYGTDTNNIPLLQKYLFMLGEKGRAFRKPVYSERDNVFEFIWDKLHNKVCELRFCSCGTYEKVQQFLNENPEFRDYFSNENNKSIFIENEQGSDAVRKAVADYYLILLHTIGKSGNTRSYFLSSSTNISVANEFEGEKGIILYGWVPRKGLKNKIISYEDTCKCNDLIGDLHLPVCQPIYPKQKEICLKCGLLPHFIIGFQHEKNFYINPNTLKTWHDGIVYNGLDIDQKDFIKVFEKTSYSNFYMFSDGNYVVIDGENTRGF